MGRFLCLDLMNMDSWSLEMLSPSLHPCAAFLVVFHKIEIDKKITDAIQVAVSYLMLDDSLLLRAPRQRSEQYLTSSQFFSHFFRQANGSPQLAQIFSGRSAFLRIRISNAPDFDG